jgi:hypothetical protein
MKYKINKKDLLNFLLEARSKTYASNGGKVDKPLIEGSRQFEYSSNDWLYRDIYNIGNSKFIGIEIVSFKTTPVASMSYYGNFEKMTEVEVDVVLRKALIDKQRLVRIWNTVNYNIDNYTYHNKGSGNINQYEGKETISKDGGVIYFFQYTGGFIG